MITATAASVGLVGAGAAAGDHIWARHVEIHCYTVREVELDILPPLARTQRVLHISDIHLLPEQERKLAFLRHLASLRPHQVIDTGYNAASTTAVPLLVRDVGPHVRIAAASVVSLY